MMDPIYLSEFLQSGRLNGLQVGMTQEQVLQTLGEPEDVGGTSRKYRKPSVWKYGNLELFFNRTPPYTCFRIYIEFPFPEMPIRLPDCFEVAEWGLPPGADRDGVERYLHAHRIGFEITLPSGCLPLNYTVACSGVAISFDDDGLLWAITVGLM
jgi:hypothetical protein